MKVLSFGSLNIDTVYHVDHIVMPGETISSESVQTNCGGKGLNQSIALAKAGMEVWHAGMVGEDGNILFQALEAAGVKTSLIRRIKEKSGNAVIQVEKGGQNSIVLYGGANCCIDSAYVDEALKNFEAGDILVIQNEISSLEYLIHQASERKMEICFNPSPMDAQLQSFDYSVISMLLLNEVEGRQITGETESGKILEVLEKRFTDTKIVLTLGSEGAVFSCKGARQYQAVFPVKVIDTTAAGDTFTGYFISEYYRSKNIVHALKTAACAAAIAVSRAGAASSIPLHHEVIEQMEERGC